MTKKIFEELPARKHAPAKAAPAAAGKGTGNVEGEGSEKKIRQAVYDIRYRARREGIDLRAAYSQYMSNSNLTAPEQAAVRAKLFGKDGGGEKKESYDMVMNDGATSAVAKAMFQVFVEKNIKEEEIQEDATSEKKYKVRVIDEKSGRSYVRYADRQKITELRAKGLKVEMTEHGDPYEGKKERKGGLDPVAKNPAKRDGDVNNDGKKDGTDKYIYNRRDAINKAIEKRKGMKEEFLADGTTSTEGQNRGKITGKDVDNYKTGVVKVMPTTESASKLQSLIAEKKKVAESKIGKECSCCGNTITESGCGCGPDCGHCGGKGKVEESVKEEKKEISAGERKTYRELLKAKLRAMGMKNPLIMNMNPGEEETMKAMTSSSAKMAATCEEKVQPVSLYGEAMVMITDSLIEEGYSEDNIFDAIDNLTEEQVQQLEEGIGAVIGAGVRSLRNAPGVRRLISKGVNIVKNVMGRGKAGQSAVGKRATKVVKDQRAGVAGTADDLNLMQKDVEAVSSKLKKLKNPTRGDAVAAAGRVERDVRRASNYGPQFPKPGQTYGARIEKPKSTGGKVGVEVPNQSSIVRPLSYKEMMAKRRKEFAGKTEAEKKEIFNQYIKRWEQNNK